MSDSERWNGPNGATIGTGSQPQELRSLGDHCREIEHDAYELTTAVEDATNDLERYLARQVEERPYTTLGVAAGVGYFLGGGFRSRLTSILLGTATRLAVALAARELAARLSSGVAASVQNRRS